MWRSRKQSWNRCLAISWDLSASPRAFTRRCRTCSQSVGTRPLPSPTLPLASRPPPSIARLRPPRCTWSALTPCSRPSPTSPRDTLSSPNGSPRPSERWKVSSHRVTRPPPPPPPPPGTVMCRPSSGTRWPTCAGVHLAAETWPLLSTLSVDGRCSSATSPDATLSPTPALSQLTTSSSLDYRSASWRPPHRPTWFLSLATPT
mmetsp:Transcript_46630/g.101241  ORF Transcript_46630/g.101241 Transcript_46630/m.101241 type:complete len:203 (+) Transcript_46630:1731-2339(+)